MGGIVNAVFGGGDSGGGGSAQTSSQQPTNQNITTSNIAPWAQPGVTNLINAGMGQVFESNPDGSINFNKMKGYTPFDASTAAGQEWVQGAQGSVAGLSPLQQQAATSLANMQTPSQYGLGMDFATQAGMGALGTTGQAAGYGAAGANYGAAGANYGAAGATQALQNSQNAINQATGYGALGAGYGSQAAGLAPQAQRYGQNAANIGMGGLNYGAQGSQAASQNAGLSNMYGAAGAGAGQQAAGQSSAYGNLGAQTGAQAAGQSSAYGNLGAATGAQAANTSSMLGMGAVGQGQQGANIGASLGQQSTNPSAVGAYMSPYIQNVLAPALALQEQEFGMKNMQNQAQATQQGAFGGGRSAVMQGLNQQNQALAQNQLVSNAYNQAFNSAQSQMNTANQAALAGNAQAQTGFGQGLTGANQAGQLGMAGTAQGLQGAQQAGQLGMAGTAQGLQGANQAGQLGMQGYNMGLSGAGQAGQLGVSGANVGLAGTNTAISGQQAGLAGLNQAGSLFGQGMQGAQTGLSGVGQQVNAGNLGLAGTAQGIQGAQAGMQGAQTGLQGVGAQQAGYAGAGAQGTNLANIAGAQTQTGLNIAAAQQGAGATEQQYRQNILNQAMANYNTAQTQPMTQLAQLESLYTGAPQNITSSTYSAAPSTTSQIAGLAGTALAGAKLAGAKAGGSVKDIKKMAGGGLSGPVGRVERSLENMDAAELQEAIKTSTSPFVREKAKELLPDAMQRGAGVTGARSGKSFAAGGGIVAFADGGYAFSPEEMIAGTTRQTPLPPIQAPASGGLKNVMSYLNQLKGLGYGTATEEEKASRDEIKSERAELKANKDKNKWLALLEGSGAALTETSPFGNVGVGKMISTGTKAYTGLEKDYADQLAKLRSGDIDLNKLSSTDRNNLLHYAMSGATSEENTRMRTAEMLEAAKLRNSQVGNANADREQLKLLTIAKDFYAADLKAAQDKLGIDKVTEEMKQTIYNNAMRRASQVPNMLKQGAKDGIKVGAENAPGAMKFDAKGNLIQG